MSKLYWKNIPLDCILYMEYVFGVYVPVGNNLRKKVYVYKIQKYLYQIHNFHSACFDTNQKVICDTILTSNNVNLLKLSN